MHEQKPSSGETKHQKWHSLVPTHAHSSYYQRWSLLPRLFHTPPAGGRAADSQRFCTSGVLFGIQLWPVCRVQKKEGSMNCRAALREKQCGPFSPCVCRARSSSRKAVQHNSWPNKRFHTSQKTARHKSRRCRSQRFVVKSFCGSWRGQTPFEGSAAKANPRDLETAGRSNQILSGIPHTSRVFLSFKPLDKFRDTVFSTLNKLQFPERSPYLAAVQTNTTTSTRLLSLAVGICLLGFLLHDCSHRIVVFHMTVYVLTLQSGK
ncbi:uncharacterized protein LOC128421481 [Podarcis raffonei]|uniref:uncharacterized protein LOC128421481 n=1 Tax=Podarcis raffonei TaxID=65483 RepID=UPI00232950C8|nr:uncharacterized protein LOC128421481 [Podarcis raffonei]